jgi:hypothetical protein
VNDVSLEERVMKEHNRHRLALIDARFGRTNAERSDAEAFDDAFLRVANDVIRPVMNEVIAELEKLGHSPRIEMGRLPHEGNWISPAIALHIGMRGRGEHSGYVAFGVAREGSSVDVLAWLVVPPRPFDLLRYAHPNEIVADHVEQLLVDATEHLFAHANS